MMRHLAGPPHLTRQTWTAAPTTLHSTTRAVTPTHRRTSRLGPRSTRPSPPRSGARPPRLLPLLPPHRMRRQPPTHSRPAGSPSRARTKTESRRAALPSWDPGNERTRLRYHRYDQSVRLFIIIIETLLTL